MAAWTTDGNIHSPPPKSVCTAGYLEAYFRAKLNGGYSLTFFTYRYTLWSEMSNPITSCISFPQSKLGFNFPLSSVQSTPPCTSKRSNEKSEVAIEKSCFGSPRFPVVQSNEFSGKLYLTLITSKDTRKSNRQDTHAVSVFQRIKSHSFSHSFYSCELSCLAYDYKRGWRWPSLIQTSLFFSCKSQLVSIRTTWFTQKKTVRSVPK